MTDTPTENRSAHKAGAFDVRTFIALLIGIYGAVLVVMGLFATSDEDLAKADGFNVNLWAGLGMLVAAAAFQAWAMLKPIVVPDDPEGDGTDGGGGEPRAGE